MHRSPVPVRSAWLVLLGVVAIGCSSPASNDDRTPTTLTPTTATATDASGSGSSSGDATNSTTTAPTTTGPVADSSSTTTGDSGRDPCLFCDAPNEACIDDACVTTCQGQQPDPCGPDQVCDVISGECRAPDTACTLAGEIEACGESSCGAGSVCDGEDSCIPIPPCADVVCTDEGSCWGNLCGCERQVQCEPPSEKLLNGPFAVEISDLEFADDCTAWMVTLRSGTDFLRRLEVDGTLTEWGGVANLNMGEVKVLKAVTPPTGIVGGTPKSLATQPGSSNAGDPALRTPSLNGMEGLGEVAITYTCCSTCGCFVEPPQGVARLVEADAKNPLPLVIEAVVTTGTGPFGVATADAGPFGLTWGIDRVLYVGNSTNNGDLVTADLDARSQASIGTLPSRITASAPISAAHLLVAVEGGDVYRFNVRTQQASLALSLGEDVTSLSHDAFDGTVYAGLRSLEVVAIDPWAGTSEPFETMPGRGRVTVSPDGGLWFSPVAILDPNAIFAWDLPTSF